MVGVEKTACVFAPGLTIRRDPGLDIPLRRGLAEFLLHDLISFSLLSGFSFHLFELGQQQALVTELMDMGRSEIHQRLMRPVVMVSLDVAADLFFGRDLIGIIPDQIDLLLLIVQ